MFHVEKVKTKTLISHRHKTQSSHSYWNVFSEFVEQVEEPIKLWIWIGLGLLWLADIQKEAVINFALDRKTFRWNSLVSVRRKEENEWQWDRQSDKSTDKINGDPFMVWYLIDRYCLGYGFLFTFFTHFFFKLYLISQS